MINLRYHIVSITAVFLALGIGVALGSTFLDKATVDVLDRNIRSAEARIRATDAENARLETEVEAAQERDKALSASPTVNLFEGDLTDLPVVLVTSQGVDGDVLAKLQASLQRAGADLRGVLELRDGLALTEAVPDAVAATVGQDPEDQDAARSAVYASLSQALSSAGQPAETGTTGAGQTATTVAAPAIGTTAGASTTTTTVATTTTTGSSTPSTSEPAVPDGTQPAIVSALIEADLLRFTPAPGRSQGEPVLEKRGYRYVFLGGPGLDATALNVMTAILPGAAADALPAVLVSATIPSAADGEESGTTIVAQVRSDEDLAALYSTVDDVDTFAGLTATIVVLRDLPSAETGHYGQAEGARAVLPGPS